MRISELEKALRDGKRNFPGRPALAVLARDDIEVPPVFADSAKSFASRSPQMAAKGSRVRAQKDNWI
jgi:hypothetical protein